jgi:predicted transcriptional regulator
MLLNMGKNGNKNRCRLDIVRDVLSIALVKVRKTRIMYQANLSYVQLEKYLKVLLDGGLVECDGDSCYLITQKGREFLEAYANYLERCSRIRKEADGTARDRQLLEGMCFNGKSNGAQTAVRRMFRRDNQAKL